MEEDFFIDKKAKRAFVIAAFITIVPLIVFMYWEISHGVGGYQLVLQNAKAESFYGAVDSIYNDKANHNVEVLVLSGGYEYELYREWATKVNIGDSLSKDYGSLKVKVYRKSGGTDTLDYQKLINSFNN